MAQQSAQKSTKANNATPNAISEKSYGRIFGDIATLIAREMGRAHTFMIAVLMIVV